MEQSVKIIYAKLLHKLQVESFEIFTCCLAALLAT